MNGKQIAVVVAVWDEERRSVEEATFVGRSTHRRGQLDAADAQPTHNARINLALGKEEVGCFGVDDRFADKVLQLGYVGCNCLARFLLCWFPLGEDHVVLISQPLTGFDEWFVEHLHGEVDSASVSATDIASEGVLRHAE